MKYVFCMNIWKIQTSQAIFNGNPEKDLTCYNLRFIWKVFVLKFLLGKKLYPVKYNNYDRWFIWRSGVRVFTGKEEFLVEKPTTAVIIMVGLKLAEHLATL